MWRCTMLLSLIAQAAPPQSLWQWIQSKSLPLGIIASGVALAIILLAVLRGRQTLAGQLPKSQRWLLLILIALAAGGSAAIVIRAVIR